MCRQFLHTGVCKKKACKLAHVPSEFDPLNRSNQAQQPVETNKKHKKDRPVSESEREFLSWKNSVPSDRSPNQPLGGTSASYFQEARRLIDIDDNLLQNVVRSLSAASSLGRIRRLIDDGTGLPISMKTTIFFKEIIPFLEILAHPKVQSSLLLEKQVGTLYDCISGWRGIHLFSLVADVLAIVNANENPFIIGHLETSLIVLSQLIELNQMPVVHGPFELLANRFEDVLRTLGSFGSTNLLHRAHSHLERIHSSLRADKHLPASHETPSNTVQQKQTIGRASSYDPPGGRHDNDHDDICRIRIVPTSQEILSFQPEYLPTKDPRQWHVGGVNGLLERHFRLLREDTIGKLRDAVRCGLDSSHQDLPGNLLRTNVYEGATITGIRFSRFFGFQFDVAFPQPLNISYLTPYQRQWWWALSRRLQPETLVCLIDFHGRSLFCNVVAPERTGQENKRKEREEEISNSLWNDAHSASITLGLADASDDSVQYVLDRYSPNEATFSFSVVEFPGFVLPAFQPTLAALQTMKRSGDLPFPEYLAPTGLEQRSGFVDVPPPAYSLKPGFSFDLRCLLNKNTDLEVRPGQPTDIRYLQENSSLDDAQAVSVVDTLQRKIGLIQGPPGTGKSFTGISLIKVLLANKFKANANIGPIICVCYTNHALDQLLEDLLAAGISHIVRVGSRSKSGILEPFNLRNVVKQTEKTKFEKGGQFQHYKQLEKLESSFHNLKLGKPVTDGVVRTYLRLHQKAHFDQLFVSDGKSFRRGPKKSQVLDNWLRSGVPSQGPPRSVEVLQHTHVDLMSIQERRILYNSWVNVLKADVHAQAKELASSHRTTKANFDRIRDEVDLRCLRSAGVIGVTTSGLARNLDMLRKLDSKVVICEEAGEVLETHLLTALLPSVEHAILIGDHLQLRPQIQNFALSRENVDGGEQYSLDVSLFERLVAPESGTGVQIPFSTLEVQRRMHPDISQLIRETLYPQLKDASFLFGYPPISGMQKRLYWLDHRSPEGKASNNKAAAISYWNDYEIEAVTGLVNHLVRRGGYRSSDIAVLTPYLGQLQRLQEKLSTSFAIVLGERDQDDLINTGLVSSGEEASIPRESLRVATIDNFQGEEAKVVIISLVRSNEEKNCGFLRTSNRINVLLSRAQHGMYIIGDSETSRHVPMWAQVIDILQRGGNLGTSLELRCPQHPGTMISVSEPQHFAVLGKAGMQYGMYGPGALSSCVCADMSLGFGSQFGASSGTMSGGWS